MPFLVGHIKLFLLDIRLKPSFVTTMRVRHGETTGRPTTGYLTDVAHKKSLGGGVTQYVTRMTRVKVNSEAS